MLDQEEYEGEATWENLRKALRELNHNGIVITYCACVVHDDTIARAHRENLSAKNTVEYIAR